MAFDLPPGSHYILLRTTPHVDSLSLRQALQENLAQAFGLTASGTHVDVLWVEDASGKATGSALVRVDTGEDATRVLASIASSSSAPRLELIRASSFLPSLLAEDTPL
ncbi:hypothetical protein B0H10DRAFT_2430091 [Mycena sp. CBHHK59/15]|nr:hypothetical protein B0H10DRAFT_2430091 [Mycena sp. CBHHK59/15]